MKLGFDASYTKIYSTSYIFTALKEDGSIKAWTDPDITLPESKIAKDNTNTNTNTSESLIKKLWNGFMSLIKSIFS